MTISASAFRKLDRGTLRGFVTLELQPSGLRLLDCALFDNGSKRWVGLPSKPTLDRDKRQRVDAAGKAIYSPAVEFVTKAQAKVFQAAALAAIDGLLSRGGGSS